MKMTSGIFILMAMVYSAQALRLLLVRFHPDYVIQNDTNLTDESPQTCMTFHNERALARPEKTVMRLKTLTKPSDYVNVTLIGKTLGCGYNLFLVPITKHETVTWSGIWFVCDVSENSTDEDQEKCMFTCPCRGFCEEIQITKRPRNAGESIWTLCHISVTNGIALDCSPYSVSQSGIYAINSALIGDVPIYTEVFCDMERNGGGWTVIMRRQDGSVNFTREWEDYKRGFGSLAGEFWAGSEIVHNLTSNGRQFSLRVDLVAYDGEHIFAEYDSFSLAPESDNYRLFVSGYQQTSTAGNSLGYHNGMMFSTVRRDYDAHPDLSCARIYHAPWWYRRCHDVLLTSQYGRYPNVPSNNGIKWKRPWGIERFAKEVTMKIRPV